MRLTKPTLFVAVVSLSIGLITVVHSTRTARQSLDAPATAAPPVDVSLSVMTSATDRLLRTAEADIASAPQQSAGYVTLATAYMRKARETGDPGYYLRAEAAVQQALTLQPHSFEGLRALAWIQTGKHAFAEAVATAEQLHRERPDDPWVYGVLGDAYIELGDYDEAAEVLQQMMDRRPGLPAYSRGAHLRELFGDLQGAVELMTMAVRAGSSQDPEPLAWSWVQVGNLHFNQGHLEEAEASYQHALAVFPQYPQALAAMGRVRGAQHHYAEAMGLYRQAIAIVPIPETVAALGDLLALTGNAEEAEQQYTLVEYIEHVNELNQTTYTRQLALFYADHDRQLEDARRLAEAEGARRHDIYTQDTLAWVYYKSGRMTEAERAMTQALRLGTQDALLFFHAGMIAQRLGKQQQAQEYLRRALTLNPAFHPIQADTAARVLKELERQPDTAVARK